MVCLRPTPAYIMSWIQICANASVPNKSKFGRTRLIEGDTEMECHYDILKYDPVERFKFWL